MGTPPDFDASASEVASYLEEDRTRIQIGAAIHAAWAPLLVWFLATVATLAGAAKPAARRAGMVAFGCGLAYLALFLFDVTAVAVAALRPENTSTAPELATALHDVSWLAQGIATFLGSATLGALAVLALRDRILWPRWVGWLAVAAAAVYMVRVGILFTTGGAFAADGVLGLWVPVVAIAATIAAASVTLTLRLGAGRD